MKKLWMVLAAATLVLTACEKEFGGFQPQEVEMMLTTRYSEAQASSIQGFIDQRYPAARIVEIDGDHGMTEIEIIDGRIKRELYFDVSANWVRTVTDILHAELPQAVREAYAASEYAPYRLDDVKFVESPAGDYYRLEVEIHDNDLYLHYDATGTLLTQQ